VSPAPVVPAVEPASPVAEAGIVRPDPGEARKLLDGLRALADRGGITGMSPFVWPRARARLARMTVDEVKALLSGEVAGTDVNGGRVVLRMRGNPAASVLVFHVGAGGLVWDPDASLGWREPDRGARVPENRDLSLDEACRDLSGKGRLVAVIETTRGTLTCELFADRAPRTVANFVGLARGLRAFRDVKTGKWVRRPFYDGLAFHHAVPKMLIQAGCPRGDGTGDPGYSFADEFDLSLRHDRPGRLSMAADAPNSNGSQFLVTEVPAPWLDDRRPVFGQCEPAEVVRDIARATPTDPRHGDRVGILRVTVRRED
jgi:peptidyl-prolyl cis-trans isomerase A (cyclophilin A)